MNYIEIGYGFIFVIILHQLTDFILGACSFFVMMKIIVMMTIKEVMVLDG